MEPLAHWVGNAVNPLLTACVLIAPRKRSTPWKFWARSAVSIGLAVVAAEAGKRYEVWPGHPTFPSGHETFALAAGAVLIRQDRRWLAPVLPLVLALAWALVAAQWHVPADIAGAVLTGPPLALLADWFLRRRTDAAGA